MVRTLSLSLPQPELLPVFPAGMPMVCSVSRLENGSLTSVAAIR